MMKKIVSILVIIVLIAFGYYFYQQSQTTKQEPIKEEPKKEVIKIGAIIPLTGRFAEMSLPIKNAMDVAVNEINNSGGINGKMIKVFYGDSKGDPKVGVTEALKMINVEDIKIITTFLTGVSEAVKPITEKSKILLLAQTVSPTILDNSKYTVRFHYSFIEEGKAISSYIINNNYKDVSYIQSNDPSGSYRMEKIIKPILEEKSISLTQFKFNVGTKDFNPIVLKALDNKHDILCVDGYGTDIARIIKELKKIKTNNTISLGNIGFIELPKNTLAEYYKDFIFTVPSFVTMNNEKINSFRDKYKSYSKQNKIGYAAYYAYDMMYLLSEKMKVNDNLSDLKASFIGKHQGITGAYEILSNGEMITKINFAKYKNNEIVEYKN